MDENSVPKNLENTDEDYAIILDYSSFWKTPIVIIVMITSFLFFTGYFGENWLTESVLGKFPGICLGVWISLLFIRPLWPNWLKKLYRGEME